MQAGPRSNPHHSRADSSTPFASVQNDITIRLARCLEIDLRWSGRETYNSSGRNASSGGAPPPPPPPPPLSYLCPLFVAMAPKRTVSSEGEQNAKGVKQPRRSIRLQKNAAAVAAAAPKEDSKPVKRSKIPPKAKKQPKVKITKEEAAPAQNGETKPDKEQKTESANDQTD